MTTIHNRVVSAWESGVPFALDGVAQEWASEGRNKTELYDALERLLLDVRAKGADDDAEDRIIGVMNRLTGWSHESNFIATKGSEPLVEAEIAQLPRWAKVAFAARCARRALPVFHQKWPDAPTELFTALNYATEVGAWLASQGGKANTRVTLLGAVVCAAYVCDAAFNAGQDRDRDRASQVIRQAGKAIAVLGAYQNTAAADVYKAISGNATRALAYGIATSRDNYPFALEYARSLIRGDFTTVRRLAEEHNWNDETPVPPEFFGTLDFDGMPAAWFAHSLPLVGTAKTSTDAASIVRVGVDIIDAMNRYLSSHGEEPISVVPEQSSVAV